ncbi:MAG TPA: hypothetical protein VG405_02590 [Solirubrobacteraceae bacterium]|jgi:hypothetical protein|nr:hypothetical protein [Solirubrobacteraceae bacterium]
MIGPLKVVGKAATEALTGMGPSPVRAAAAATVVGAASAVATYKLLRSRN